MNHTGDAGLVLAAGAGRRFGGPKAIVEIDGQRLIDLAVHHLWAAGCSDVWVVLGAWVGPVDRAHVVENRDWESGMSSSLRVGLQALTHDSVADRVVITLVDLIDLTTEAIVEVRAGSQRICVATYDGQQGHPVVIGREWWPAVCESAHADTGARGFLSEHRAEVAWIEVAHLGGGADMDYPMGNGKS